MVGTAYVAKAPADGHTLLVIAGNFTVIPAVYKDLPFDTLKDFAPISLMSEKPQILIVNPSFPARTFAEYIAHAKANPGKFNLGTTGQGGVNHLMGVWLHTLTGTKATYVPYKGPADIANAIMSGEIHSTLGAMTVNIPMVKAGKASILGVSTLTRNRMIPDVPTWSEAGATDAQQSLGFVLIGFPIETCQVVVGDHGGTAADFGGSRGYHRGIGGRACGGARNDTGVSAEARAGKGAGRRGNYGYGTIDSVDRVVGGQGDRGLGEAQGT